MGLGLRESPGYWGVRGRIKESEDLICGPGWDRENLERPQKPKSWPGRESRPLSLAHLDLSPLMPLPTVSCPHAPHHLPLSPLPLLPPAAVPSQCPSRSPPSTRPGDGDPQTPDSRCPPRCCGPTVTPAWPCLTGWCSLPREPRPQGPLALPQGPRASRSPQPPAPSSAVGPSGVPAAPGVPGPAPHLEGGTLRRPRGSPVDGPGRGGLSPGPTDRPQSSRIPSSEPHRPQASPVTSLLSHI